MSDYGKGTLSTVSPANLFHLYISELAKLELVKTNA